MKAILKAGILISLSVGLLHGEEIRGDWSSMVGKNATKTKVIITSSQTNSFGGVSTTTYDLHGEGDGDPALSLYHEVTSRFHEWAESLGAEHSTINDSGGRMALRIKTPDGGYLSAIYEPGRGESVEGSLLIVYVDADEFARPESGRTTKTGQAAVD